MFSSTSKLQNSEESQNQFKSSMWHLLHSMSAYYPDEPTEQEINDHKEALLDIAEVSSEYLSGWSKNFIKYYESHPPNLANRKSFSIWMCEHHNRMRKDEEKALFSCEYENLKKRWGPS